MLRLSEYTWSALSSPSAEKLPGCGGMTTCLTCSSSSAAGSSIGPAAPYASSEKSRGSTPWRIAMFVTSSAMLFTAMRYANAIRCSTDSGDSSASKAFHARSESRCTSPEAKPSGSRMPMSSAASVTVGSSPPQP